MAGEALSVGPIALLIAVLGHVLKRWWDNADTFMEARKIAYQEYFAATYELEYQLHNYPFGGDEEAYQTALKAFQACSPNFLLHASPIAITMSDFFYSRSLEVRRALEAGAPIEVLAQLRDQMHEAHGLLRETVKTEMFSTQPRFLLERFRYRRRWKAIQQQQGPESRPGP